MLEELIRLQICRSPGDYGPSGQVDATVANFKNVKWCEVPAGGSGLNVCITIAEGYGVGIQGCVGAEG